MTLPGWIPCKHDFRSNKPRKKEGKEVYKKPQIFLFNGEKKNVDFFVFLCAQNLVVENVIWLYFENDVVKWRDTKAAQVPLKQRLNQFFIVDNVLLL